MTIDLQVINQRHNPQVEAFAFERFEKLSRRLSSRLVNIAVQIREASASKPHMKKRCSIDATIAAYGKLHVSATESNVYAAIHKAVNRLDSAIATRLSRRSHAVSRHRQAREATSIETSSPPGDSEDYLTDLD